MEGLVMINVLGRCGYSFVVRCDDEDEAVERALLAGLFLDDDDVCRVTTSEVTEQDYEFFKGNIFEV